METIVYAELRVSGCYATLWLNDIPILSTGRLGSVFTHMAARQFLVRGMNRLELVVEPVVPPSRARTETRKLRLEDKWAIARLVRYDEGVPALVENGTRLLEHHWIADGKEDTYPKVLEGTVAISDAAHRWGWEDAPLLTLDEATRKEAIAVLEAVGDTIAGNDLQRFLWVTEEKIRDSITAYPASAAIVQDQLRSFLDFWSRAEPPLFPLNDEAHDFRLVAGGRLLETVDADAFASLRLRDPSDGAAVPYPLFLARVGDRLKVVR